MRRSTSEEAAELEARETGPSPAASGSTFENANMHASATANKTSTSFRRIRSPFLVEQAPEWKTFVYRDFTVHQPMLPRQFHAENGNLCKIRLGVVSVPLTRGSIPARKALRMEMRFRGHRDFSRGCIEAGPNK